MGRFLFFSSIKNSKQETLFYKGMDNNKSTTAIFISIGDEVLNGQVLNTNAQFISSTLDAAGIVTIEQLTISDSAEAIKNTLVKALQITDIVIITGGLGPTKDDVTKHTLAEFFNSPLYMHQEALAHITKLVTNRKREMNALNEQQALFPEKAIYLQNNNGTAPGMLFITEEGKMVFSLPGVPFEMKELMHTGVMPHILKQFNQQYIGHYFVKTIGIPESVIAGKVEEWENNLPADVKLAYLPAFGEVRLRLTKMGESKEAVWPQLEALAQQVYPILAPYIYTVGEDISIDSMVTSELVSQGYTLGIAESCTGGALAALLTAKEGASNYLKGSLVSYATSIKQDYLGVNDIMLEDYGVVSKEVALQMAYGAKEFFKSNAGIGITGIAGPAHPSDEKEVGTICIAAVLNNLSFVEERKLTTQRETNIRWASIIALDMLRKLLRKEKEALTEA